MLSEFDCSLSAWWTRYHRTAGLPLPTSLAEADVRVTAMSIAILSIPFTLASRSKLFPNPTRLSLLEGINFDPTDNFHN